MKNVKMILTAISVFAVVGGALAFKPNYGRQFCASVTKDSGCTIIAKRYGMGANNFFEYHFWNGDQADCLTNRCPDAVNLVDD